MVQQRQTIEDERLKGLVLACPDCGTPMKGTGKMRLDRVTGRYLAEFWCPADREPREIWTPESDKLADELSRG